MKTLNNTNNKLTKAGLVLLASLVFTSCKKDKKVDLPAPLAQEFSAVREKALENVSQTFSFNAQDGFKTFTTAKGVVISIDGNCLTKNGSPVTGEVKIEYAEVFDAGTMLVTDKTTMGKLPNGDMAMIISGGEFFVQATQNGVPLNTGCGFNLKIPANLTGGIKPGMVLWNGTFDEDGNLEWKEKAADGANGKDRVFGEGNGANAAYYATLSNFGWTNVDKFYNDPRPKTTILATAPTGYNFENSAIYLHYDGEGSALAKLDTYNAATQQFSEHYGQIPIGLNCHIIFATEDNGQWRYAIKPATIAANAVYSFTLAETTVGTEAQLIAAINALP